MGEGRLSGIVFGEDDKRLGEQGIAGEQGRGFIELFVRGRTPPAEVIVVHAGQVVVDERVRVHAFEGHRCWQGRIAAGAAQFCGGEGEHGTKSFPTAQQTVAHRGMQARGARRDGRHETFEAGFDPGDPVLKFRSKIHCAVVRQNWPRCNDGAKSIAKEFGSGPQWFNSRSVFCRPASNRRAPSSPPTFFGASYIRTRHR